MISKSLAIAALLLTVRGSTALAFVGNDAELDAATSKIVSIYNDRSANYSDLEVVLDAQGAVTGAKYTTHGDGAAAPRAFTNSEISSGAVLEEQQGVKALLLSGQVDSATGTGKWTIKFISNGLSGTYKSCDLKVQRTPAGVWTGVNAYNGTTLDKAKIVTWSMGITTIQGLCN
jgi:hypothetical protein